MLSLKRTFKLFPFLAVLAITGCTAEEIGRTLYNSGKQICGQAHNCDQQKDQLRK
jgi:hypothetical protein